MGSAAGFSEVDWSKLPVPADDGAARHLAGARLPDVAVASTAGRAVSLASLPGRTVLFVYPMTGTPGVALPDGWDAIPGARGCTPHACAFRDLHAELAAAGATRVFGLSTQTLAEQRATAERLHLPFPLLSDERLDLARAMALPTMEVAGQTMLKRLALIIDDGAIAKVFYPVFPPDRNPGEVLAWLEANPQAAQPWRYPAPEDDGGARHLVPDTEMPDIALPSTLGRDVSIARIAGRAVVFVYPWTGRPGLVDPPGWDVIAGAHGSTPEAEGFRDLFPAYRGQGIEIYGLSLQGPEHQRELATRLALPYPLLSDEACFVQRALALPVFEIGRATYLRRLTLVIRDGRLERVVYPVHPPHTHAADLLATLVG